jgi:hypothetical protein
MLLCASSNYLLERDGYYSFFPYSGHRTCVLRYIVTLNFIDIQFFLLLKPSQVEIEDEIRGHRNGTAMSGPQTPTSQYSHKIISRLYLRLPGGRDHTIPFQCKPEDCGYMIGTKVIKIYRRPLMPTGTMVLIATFVLIQ